MAPGRKYGSGHDVTAVIAFPIGACIAAATGPGREILYANNLPAELERGNAL